MRRHVKSDNERTLTRTELRQVLFACCPSLSRQDVSKVLDGFFEEVGEALARGESLKLRSFGAFKVRSKRGRAGRNPKTGVEAPITPRRVLIFKASPVLVGRVNGEAINDEAE